MSLLVGDTVSMSLLCVTLCAGSSSIGGTGTPAWDSHQLGSRDWGGERRDTAARQGKRIAIMPDLCSRWLSHVPTAALIRGRL